MRRIVVRAAIVFVVIAVGIFASFSFSPHAPASASPSHLLRWMAPVHQNGIFCFGIAGWHPWAGAGTASVAGDIFANSQACGGWQSSEVFPLTYGYTFSGSAYNLLAVAVPSTQTYTNCTAARVDLYRWNGFWELVGREMYAHTQPAANLPVYYEIPMGNGTWAWNWGPQLGPSFPHPKRSVP